MRSNISSSNESRKVIPFDEMERGFDLLLRELPEHPNLADLTKGTIKYIEGKGLKASNEDNLPEIERIISDFQKRFLQKFPHLDNSEELAAKEREKEADASKYNAYSASIGGKNKPSKPEAHGNFSEKTMKQLIKDSSYTGLQNLEESNDDDTK